MGRTASSGAPRAQRRQRGERQDQHAEARGAEPHARARFSFEIEGASLDSASDARASTFAGTNASGAKRWNCGIQPSWASRSARSRPVGGSGSRPSSRTRWAHLGLARAERDAVTPRARELGQRAPFRGQRIGQDLVGARVRRVVSRRHVAVDTGRRRAAREGGAEAPIAVRMGDRLVTRAAESRRRRSTPACRPSRRARRGRRPRRSRGDRRRGSRRRSRRRESGRSRATGAPRRRPPRRRRARDSGRSRRSPRSVRSAISATATPSAAATAARLTCERPAP